MKINPEFKKVAIFAAKEAGKILEKNFRKVVKVSFKKDSSLVTKIDLEVERVIIQLIKNNFPSHDILSEEAGGKIGKNYTWVIDPLDGTTNYTRNIPFFSTSVALLYQGVPILGVVFDPINKELYIAEKGKRAFLNGKRIRVAQRHVLSKAVFLFNKYRAKEDFLRFQEILGLVGDKCATLRVLGSVILGLCYLASGKADAFFTVGHKPWDLVAGALIISESGGRVTNLLGDDWQVEEKNIIAANGRIHKQIIKLINS